MIQRPFKIKNGGIFYFARREVAERVRDNLENDGHTAVRIIATADGYKIHSYQTETSWGYPKDFGICGWCDDRDRREGGLF